MNFFRCVDKNNNSIEVHMTRGICDICKLKGICATFVKKMEDTRKFSFGQKVHAVKICTDCAEIVYSRGADMFRRLEQKLKNSKPDGNKKKLDSIQYKVVRRKGGNNG